MQRGFSLHISTLIACTLAIASCSAPTTVGAPGGEATSSRALAEASEVAQVSMGDAVLVATEQSAVHLAMAPAQTEVMGAADVAFVAAEDVALTPLAGPLEPVTCSPRALRLPRFAPSPKDQLQPAFDAVAERSWIGPGHDLEPSRGRGTWAVDALGGLVFDDGERGTAQWIMHRKRAAFGDGMVRARFTVDRQLTTTLLFRATTTDFRDPAKTSGYGLRFDGYLATLVRLDEGVVTELGASEVVYRIHRRDAIEVLVFALGDQLHAQIHDAGTGVELTVLSARDATYALGQVGVVAPEDHGMSDGARLAALSTRAACKRLPKLGQVSDPPKRFVTLTEEVFDGLDRRAARGVTEVERVAGRVTARTDVLGLERLHCAGVPLDEISTNVPWKYLDDTYLDYRDLGPVQDAHGGFRVDLSPKSPRMVEAILKSLHRAFPRHTELEEIGRSRRGRPIFAMAISKDLEARDERPAILLNGAHHGDEPSSTDITLDAAVQLLTAEARGDEEAMRWLESFVVWVVPQVNPDGALNFLERSRRSGRKNGHDSAGDGVEVWDRREGVDLNRNYPFRFAGVPDDEGSSPDPLHDKHRGERAASEPETRAMLGLFEAERFVASISYHSGTVCVLAPYTIPDTADPTPNEAWTVAQELTLKMPRHPEGRPFELKRNLYSVDGTDQDTFRHRYGSLALLVEAVRFSPRTVCQRRSVIEVNRASWRLLLKRTLEGPFVYGRVVDARGRPVRAPLRVGEQVLPNGEVWETRPRDGTFGRYVGEAGPVVLEVAMKGRPVVRRAVEVGDVATEVEVVLPFEVGD